MVGLKSDHSYSVKAFIYIEHAWQLRGGRNGWTKNRLFSDLNRAVIKIRPISDQKRGLKREVLIVIVG